jgi:membrane fusion protein, multidrug efflux system
MNTVQVVAQVTGQVVEVHFVEGQSVKAGDLLFTIDTRAYRANLAFANAELERGKALAQQADGESQRYARLQASGLASEEELANARTQAASAAAELKAAGAQITNAQLNLQFAKIRSPIAARTSELKVHVGNVVRANDPAALVVLRKLAPIYVRFSVPQDYLSKVQAGLQAGGLVTHATPRGNRAEPPAGKVVFLESTVESGTGALTLKALFENPDARLWPGATVDVKLEVEHLKQAIIVPEAAVQQGQTGPFAYVVENETARMRQLSVRYSDDRNAIISDGLKAGEQVVTDGFVRLVDGTPVSVQP